jgi:hypothetical protein
LKKEGPFAFKRSVTGTELKNEMAKSRERLIQNKEQDANVKKKGGPISKKALLQGKGAGVKKRWTTPNSP